MLADNATGPGPDVDTALAVLKKALNGIENGPTSAEEELLGPVFKAMTEDSYGWALYKNEAYPDALTALTQALEDYPVNSPREALKVSYYHLGVVYAKLGRKDQAANAFNSAIAYDAKYDDALAALADGTDRWPICSLLFESTPLPAAGAPGPRQRVPVPLTQDKKK